MFRVHIRGARSSPFPRVDVPREAPFSGLALARVPCWALEKEDSGRRCLAVNQCLSLAVATSFRARRGGGTEGVVPAPPAQEIKAAAALPPSKALVRRRAVGASHTHKVL